MPFIRCYCAYLLRKLCYCIPGCIQTYQHILPQLQPIQVYSWNTLSDNSRRNRLLIGKGCTSDPTVSVIFVSLLTRCLVLVFRTFIGIGLFSKGPNEANTFECPNAIFGNIILLTFACLLVLTSLLMNPISKLGIA